MQWKKQKGDKCKREICLCKGQFAKPKDLDLKELKAKAEEENVNGFDKMNKQELLNRLNHFPFAKWDFWRRWKKIT